MLPVLPFPCLANPQWLGKWGGYCTKGQYFLSPISGVPLSYCAASRGHHHTMAGRWRRVYHGGLESGIPTKNHGIYGFCYVVA